MQLAYCSASCLRVLSALCCSSCWAANHLAACTSAVHHCCGTCTFEHCVVHGLFKFGPYGRLYLVLQYAVRGPPMVCADRAKVPKALAVPLAEFACGSFTTGGLGTSYCHPCSPKPTFRV
jgi:hypothetical protein